MMSEPILKVRGLKKHFSIYSGLFKRCVGKVSAVDGVDFDLFPQEVLGVVGESGCGKSTIARVVLRLLEPTAGEITFLGKDFRALNSTQLRETRKQMQIVFQDPYASLNPRRTIGDSIGEALVYHQQVRDNTDERAKVAAILERIGLSPDMMHRYPHQFSGGQQQRICIGRAIALEPRLIVCDEAVSALDVSVQAQILNLLDDLKGSMNLSYLFISHDLSVIRHISDRVIVLYLGKVMELASVDELFNHPKHPYTQFLLSAIPSMHPNMKKKRTLLTGEIPSAINPPSGCPFRTRCPYAQSICAEPPPKKIVKNENGKEHYYYCILD